MIEGVHHTGLSVLDLDAAIKFYTQAQSFELLYRFEVADSPVNRVMLQVENASARAAFMRGTLGCLELFEFAGRGLAAAPDRAVYAAGIRHICLQTEISDRLYDSLVTSGASAHARPSGLGTGNSYVYIRDPEGNLIELEGTPWAPAGASRPWFAHTALVTPDIDRLTSFYAMLTGIDVHRRGSFGPDAKFDLVAGIADVRFHGAWLRLSNAELEFWQYEAPKTVPAERRSAAAPGWNHICFESDDIASEYKRLIAQGIDLHGPPHDFGNAQVFFGRDPDGNIFEVLQPGRGAEATVEKMLTDGEGSQVDAARIAARSGA
jgi:catechol 2,3-dioxygenase-like lactoylglutathione lyase family enzyme